jgi:type VI secretion system protein ImpF
MAGLTPNDRLQPALLDRLTDDDPATHSEPREARMVSRQRLKQAVLRDLAWLLNATRMVGVADWSAAPAAQRSVINFGMPALAGETASTLDITELERSMRQTIIDFEPRIDPATLSVAAETAPGALDHHNQIQVRIRGNLWAQPVPIELLLRTEVDLETGQVDIEDLGR